MPDSYDKFSGPENRMNDMSNRPNMSDEDINRFKRVFESGDGQYVFCMILDMCKFMEQCDNERDMALNNFAKILMTTVYWDKERNLLNTHSIIEFIKMKLKIRKRRKK